MRAAWLGVAAALVFVSGCAQKDWIDRTLVTVDVTGLWEGTYTGTGGSGGVRFVLQQQGAKVTGEMEIEGTGGRSPGASDEGVVLVEGIVSGDTFTFTFDEKVGPTAHGEFQVKGDEMIGSWSRLFTQKATLRRQQ